LINRSSRS
jgi:hypothetical protein